MNDLIERLRSNGRLGPDREEAADEIERLTAENAGLHHDWAWVCRKLGLPEDAHLTRGDKSVAGAMHNVCSNSHGYVTYIEAHKCDDKQGEIARLTVQRDALAAQVEVLRDSLLTIKDATHFTDKHLAEEMRDTAKAALSLDTSSAESLLREREAKVLEEAAEKCIDHDRASWLRRLAAERRAK